MNNHAQVISVFKFTLREVSGDCLALAVSSLPLHPVHPPRDAYRRAAHAVAAAEVAERFGLDTATVLALVRGAGPAEPASAGAFGVAGVAL